jgi:hypothetical protein
MMKYIAYFCLTGVLLNSGLIVSAFGDTADPNWGPGVFVFDAQMPMDSIQETIDRVYAEQERSEFGRQRYAFLFKPGQYNLDVKVGYYTQVLGLGQSPDDVVITGAVRCISKSRGNVRANRQRSRRGNVLTNFWRACENMSVVPTVEAANLWAVSQAAPFRRMHVKGDLQLHDGGYASGGFMADSKIDGVVTSGPQQQWFTRNSALGRWEGGVWNMFFLGVVNPPSGTWPEPPYTVIEQTPRVREKPFLMLDKEDRYCVFVPALRKNCTGTSWSDGPAAGECIPLERFYMARAAKDNAASINAALEAGKHLLLTPGIYHLEESIRVTRPGTVVLGLGLATLTPENGTIAMEVADVDGVVLAGVLFDAGAEESPNLLRVGSAGSLKDHSDNPISLYDIFCRVGGAGVGKAAVSVVINSRDVIGDHFWLWRADHGDGVGWDKNVTKNALVVNGENVTIYGLFVEHYHEYQTVWNADGGRVYFYQSEMPYDPPSQAAWSHDGVDGYASYKVADTVKTHEAWGIGVYCVFRGAPVIAENAIETPAGAGIKMHHLVTIRLSGLAGSGIRHIINGKGNSVIDTQKATMD